MAVELAPADQELSLLRDEESLVDLDDSEEADVE
jgi:hypothetical protein